MREGCMSIFTSTDTNISLSFTPAILRCMFVIFDLMTYIHTYIHTCLCVFICVYVHVPVLSIYENIKISGT